MQDTTSSAPLPGIHKEEGLAPMAQASERQPRKAAPAADAPKAPGLMARLMGFFRRLFTRKRDVRHAMQVAEQRNAAERKAVSRAAQMPEPVAFVSDTASTLVTPMGTYAGKPVDLALRKRAEQQFGTMDISQTTMH